MMIRCMLAGLTLVLGSASIQAQEKRRFKAPPDINFRTVDIYSEGTRMAGELFSPKDKAGKLPTIVMSHGWGGTVAALRPDATVFAQAGFLVLAFDYRGWGNSDARLISVGKPREPAGDHFLMEVAEVRGVVDPIDQTTDILNALHWIQAEPQCDPARIGIWGSSYSGGHVVYVAAREPRVKALVSQVGALNSRFAIEDRQHAFAQATARARGEIGYPKPFARYKGLTGQPVWEKLMRYAPINDIERCEKCAKLFIIAENEELFDNKNHAIAAHQRASGVKKLVTIKGITHYGIYREKRKEAQQLAVDWFTKHL